MAKKHSNKKSKKIKVVKESVGTRFREVKSDNNLPVDAKNLDVSLLLDKNSVSDDSPEFSSDDLLKVSEFVVNDPVVQGRVDNSNTSRSGRTAPLIRPSNASQAGSTDTSNESLESVASSTPSRSDGRTHGTNRGGGDVEEARGYDPGIRSRRSSPGSRDSGFADYAGVIERQEVSYEASVIDINRLRVAHFDQAPQGAFDFTPRAIDTQDFARRNLLSSSERRALDLGAGGMEEYISSPQAFDSLEESHRRRTTSEFQQNYESRAKKLR